MCQQFCDLPILFNSHYFLSRSHYFQKHDMSNVFQTTSESSMKVQEPLPASAMDSMNEVSLIDKHTIAEQLLSFKRVSPSPGHDVIQMSEKIDDEHHNRPKVAKKKSKTKNKKDTSGRLLPKQAVAILKEWILSPEHFSFPYPTDEEKKVLMAKTGLDLKQIKYWFTNARRRLWKQKLVEQQHQYSPISNVKNASGTVNNIPSASCQSSCKTTCKHVLVNKSLPNPNLSIHTQATNDLSVTTSKPL